MDKNKEQRGLNYEDAMSVNFNQKDNAQELDMNEMHSRDMQGPQVYDETEKNLRSPLWIALSHNDDDITNILIKSGYNVHQEDWIGNQNFPERFNDFSKLRRELIQRYFTPVPLLQLCRRIIRKQLGLNIHEKLNTLDISASLKYYLALRIDHPKEELQSTV